LAVWKWAQNLEEKYNYYIIAKGLFHHIKEEFEHLGAKI